MSQDRLSSVNLTNYVNRMKGEEILMTVKNETDVEPYAVNGVGLDGTRLGALMGFYDQVFWHSVALKWTPTVGAMTSGMLHLCFDSDPNDPTPPLISSFSKMAWYVAVPIYKSCVIKVNNIRMPSGEWMRGVLYNDPIEGERWTTFGRFFSHVAGCSAAGSSDVGQLSIVYDCSLIAPQSDQRWGLSTCNFDRLENEGVTVSSANLQCTDTIAVTDATDSKGALKFHDSTSPIIQAQSDVFTAIYESVSGVADMYDTSGNSIRPGTRIFMRAARKIFDEVTGLFSFTGATERVGEIALDPMFTQIVRWSANYLSYFLLKRVRNIRWDA